MYESVEYCTGSTGHEAYALTNEIEYFAEITEAFYWENDYYPFKKFDLYNSDSVGAEMLEVAW